MTMPTVRWLYMLATDCDDSHPDPISRCGDTFVLLKIPFDFLPEKKRVYSTNALHKFFQPDGFPAFGVGTHAEPMVPSWLGARDLQYCCLLCKNQSNTHGVIAQNVIFVSIPFTANTVCRSPEIFENMKVILRICAFMRGFRICTSIQLNHRPRRDNR